MNTTDFSTTESLELTPEMLKAIFLDASFAIAVCDDSGRFMEVNNTCCRMLGYTRQELKALGIIEITCPEESDTADDSQHRAPDESTGGFTERRLIRKDGEILWARISTSALKDQNDDIPYYVRIIEDITSQKLTELKLKQAETLARQGGKVAKVGGWAASFKSNEVFWSREVFDINEYDGDEPPPYDLVLQRVLPEYRDLLHQAYMNCISTRAPFEVEAELETFKGNRKWIRIVGEFEDGNNTSERVVGAIQDITRQKQAERESEKLHARLFNTLATITDGFCLLDHDWRLVYMNHQAELLLNASLEEGQGGNIWENYPHLVDTPLYEGYHKAVKERKPFHLEYYSELFGSWLELNAFPTPEGLAVYFRSTSEERKLAARIAASEQRLKYVTRVTLDAAWDCDLLHDNIWWSEGFLHLLGAEQDNDSHEINTDIDFWKRNIHPDDREGVLSRLTRALDGTDSSWKYQYRFRKQNGTYVRIEDHGFIIRNEAGEAIRMVGGMMDVTERLELEEQLRQSQRLDSVGQLTGGIAHDFNNLLTVILGNAELLEMPLEPASPVRKSLQMIIDASHRGAELTQRLLAFARKQKLEPKATNTNGLVKKMGALLQRTLGEHIEIRFSLDNDIWPTFVDPNQLEAALLNLCINARDAMTDGGVLTIETRNIKLDETFTEYRHQVQAGSYTVITVSDTGTGIPPEYIDHVFEPFFTTKERGKGTGLGLSMVFGFVKQSRGHIGIYSELHQGTTIKMYLPRSDQREEPMISDTDYPVMPTGKEDILLVEDNAMVLELARDLLQSFGYSVTTACNATEALAIIRQSQKIDLLFTDMIMPGGINGAQLANEARQIRPDLKVLFTSGYTENSMMQKGSIEAGAELLNKPYQAAEMARKVRDVLDK